MDNLKRLFNIERKFDLDDKFQYDYVLNQSERTQHLPDNLYQEFLGSLKQEDFFYYPNTQEFKEKICEFYGVETNQLFLCAGSDVGIKSVFETFTDGGRVVTSEPSFPMYKVYSELYNCEYFGIPHEEDYTVSTEKILSNITNDTDLVILANPNSPMGEYKSFDEIRILLEQDVPVLIDEAYIEFSDRDSLINEINNYSNLLITRTFSKAFGAAGCRVGMVFSNEKNIELVSKFRHMYEISGISMKYCEFLLDNYSVIDDYIENVKIEKKKIISLLSNDFDVIDSDCNWIHFNDKLDNVKTKNIFDKYKVLVKYCSIPYDDRNNWCRLTIQPEMSNFDFIKELL
jgi:histidinol-phosphate aminotransferase|tara:strand:- start:137 stop:1168 length:1032 start_codon:yes stop_codon:yes gene_type:complete